MKLILFASALLALSAPATAQWLDRRTPDIPRTADGRPHLSAPAPRTPDGKPDLSGVWQGPRILVPLDETDGRVLPWAREVIAQRQENFMKDRPGYRCRPSGPELGGAWKRVVQTPSLIAILNDDLTYRLIHMDGRALERDPNPGWMGYSVGRWEGDTLVVESNGFNDKTWLTGRGWPHTEQLRITERYRRPTLGRVEIEATITDPGAYSRPWNVSLALDLRPDTEMLEAVCESSQEHWIGTVSDASKDAVRVAPDLLAAYVGSYSGYWVTNPRTVTVALRDGALIATTVTNGVVTSRDQRLVARSDTLFEGNGLAYEFVRTGSGMARQLIERHVSGAYTFAREK